MLQFLFFFYKDTFLLLRWKQCGDLNHRANRFIVREIFWETTYVRQPQMRNESIFQEYVFR